MDAFGWAVRKSIECYNAMCADNKDVAYCGVLIPRTLFHIQKPHHIGNVLAGIGWEITSKLARPRIQLADLLPGGILLQFLAIYIFYGIL
jgi:hypothetical protein